MYLYLGGGRWSKVVGGEWDEIDCMYIGSHIFSHGKMINNSLNLLRIQKISIVRIHLANPRSTIWHISPKSFVHSPASFMSKYPLS
jgi:integrase